jgi:hypothetical protein
LPDEDDDDYADPNEAPNIRQMRQEIRRLKREAKDQADAKAEVEALRRQIAVRDAGLDLDPYKLTAVERMHDGEWSADSLRATAEKLGFIGAPAPANAQVPADELARLRQIQSASAGAAEPPATVGDRELDLDARLRGAKTEAELNAVINSPEYRALRPVQRR